MGLLDSSFIKIKKTNSIVTDSSQSLSEVTTLKTLSTDFQYNALMIQFQLSDTSLKANIGVLGRNSTLTNVSLPIINSNGEILTRIEKNGVYYIDIAGLDDITVYNYGAINTTAKISYNLIPQMPVFAQTIKPIEKIASTDITLTSSTNYDVFDKLNVSKFKFVFVTVFSTGSGDTGKNHSFSVSLQPYCYYDYANTAKPGNEYTILSVTSNYSGQSEWQQVLGNLASVFLNVQSPTSGDKFHINIYGVR